MITYSAEKIYKFRCPCGHIEERHSTNDHNRFAFVRDTDVIDNTNVGIFRPIAHCAFCEHKIQFKSEGLEGMMYCLGELVE